MGSNYAMFSMKNSIATLLTALFAAGVSIGSQAQMVSPMSFDVGSSGAATISIPIEAPPGIAGLTPAISLTYNSQGRNGPAGVGWSLGGLSAISRCNYIPVEQGGGTPHSVRYQSDDAFCIDGIAIQAISGVHGAPATEYRTMMESFRRIISRGTVGSGPQYFTVETKEGLTLQYGNTADSRFLAAGNDDVSVWMVNRITDRKGNYIKVTYTTADTTIVPSVIDYGGNSKTGRATNLSVGFTYNSARSDYEQLYQGGSMSERKHLLTNIKTFEGTSLIKDYRLSYTVSEPSARNTLTTVNECDAASNCRVALSGTYDNTANSLTGSSESGMTGTWAPSSLMKVGDFDGDGKADVAAILGATVAVHRGGSVMNSVPKYTVEDKWGLSSMTWVGDFNGDGKADLASASGTNIYMKLSQGSWTGFTSATWTVTNNWGAPGYTFVGDFNGDGLSDIASASAGYVYMFLSTGTGFTSTKWSVANAWGDASYTWVGDFNGDGLADIASASGSNVYIKLSTGTGFRSETWTVSGAWGSAGYTWAADFNGDGLTDIATASGANVNVFLSKGMGGFDSRAWALSSGTWGASGYTRIGDFNGDGFSDIFSISGTTAIVRMSNGHGFRQQSWAMATAVGDSDFMWTSDFNGDGRTDVVAGKGDYVYLNVPAGGTDRLTRSQDAAGFTIDLTYTTAAIEGESKDARDVVEAGIPISPAFPLVKRVDYNAGRSDTTAREYRFLSGRIEPGGRGFLGFFSRHVKDPNTGFEDVTFYRLDYPYLGQVDQITRQQSVPAPPPYGFVIRVHRNTKIDYSCIFTTLGPNPDEGQCKDSPGHWVPVWPFPKTTLDETYEYDADGVKDEFVKRETVIEYPDEFGNPKCVTTNLLAGTYKLGYETRTCDVLNNDAVTWQIDRRVRRVVTTKVPID